MHLLLLLLAACSSPPETDKPADDTDVDSDTPPDTDPPDSDTPETDPDSDSDTPETDSDSDSDVPIDTGPPASWIPPALEGLNLVTNPGAETGDLTGWTLIAAGGDGWAVIPGGGIGGSNEFATSWDDCARRQRIDLIAAGFTPDQLDAEPVINISDHVREFCSGQDEWFIRVRLIDAAGNDMDQWGQAGSTAGGSDCVYTDDLYSELRHQFTGYGPGLRGIIFEDGGQDAEFWLGHYGPRFDDASVTLLNPP